MIVWPSELFEPYQKNLDSKNIAGLTSLMYFDGQVTHDLLNSDILAEFDSANQIGTTFPEGEKIAATWSGGKPAGVDDNPLELMLTRVDENTRNVFKIGDSTANAGAIAIEGLSGDLTIEICFSRVSYIGGNKYYFDGRYVTDRTEYSYSYFLSRAQRGGISNVSVDGVDNVDPQTLDTDLIDGSVLKFDTPANSEILIGARYSNSDALRYNDIAWIKVTDGNGTKFFSMDVDVGTTEFPDTYGSSVVAKAIWGGEIGASAEVEKYDIGGGANHYATIDDFKNDKDTVDGKVFELTVYGSTASGSLNDMHSSCTLIAAQPIDFKDTNKAGTTELSLAISSPDNKHLEFNVIGFKMSLASSNYTDGAKISYHGCLMHTDANLSVVYCSESGALHKPVVYNSVIHINNEGYGTRTILKNMRCINTAIIGGRSGISATAAMNSVAVAFKDTTPFSTVISSSNNVTAEFDWFPNRLSGDFTIPDDKKASLLGAGLNGEDLVSFLYASQPAEGDKEADMVGVSSSANVGAEATLSKVIDTDASLMVRALNNSTFTKEVVLPIEEPVNFSISTDLLKEVNYSFDVGAGASSDDTLSKTSLHEVAEDSVVHISMAMEYLGDGLEITELAIADALADLFRVSDMVAVSVIGADSEATYNKHIIFGAAEPLVVSADVELEAIKPLVASEGVDVVMALRMAKEAHLTLQETAEASIQVDFDRYSILPVDIEADNHTYTDLHKVAEITVTEIVTVSGEVKLINKEIPVYVSKASGSGSNDLIKSGANVSSVIIGGRKV